MIILPNPPKIIDQKENWARFEIEGLYPGYGLTIGNSLRRVLLSSLEGAAVTYVKIKGVQHEFSTIPGVFEDVIMIMVNLKQMRIKMHSEEPQKAELKVTGEKDITGSDFKFPSQAELVNGTCHIATLTDKKAELEMEIQVERGIGYGTVEKRKKEGRMEVGTLPVDAIFTPITRVSYKVENMRVGKRTDFDRLLLDIETDGTITPEDAFSNASDILVDHFSMMAGEFKLKSGKNELTVEEETSADGNDKEGDSEKNGVKKTKKLSKQKK